MTGNVLTPAEVAEHRDRWWEEGLCARINVLCVSHEALRADLDALKTANTECPWCSVEEKPTLAKYKSMETTITRLRGLIEGMGHEATCTVDFGDEDSDPVENGCDCIKSQVNL